MVSTEQTHAEMLVLTAQTPALAWEGSQEDAAAHPCWKDPDNMSYTAKKINSYCECQSQVLSSRSGLLAAFPCVCYGPSAPILTKAPAAPGPPACPSHGTTHSHCEGLERKRFGLERQRFAAQGEYHCHFVGTHTRESRGRDGEGTALGTVAPHHHHGMAAGLSPGRQPVPRQKRPRQAWALQRAGTASKDRRRRGLAAPRGVPRSRRGLLPRSAPAQPAGETPLPTISLSIAGAFSCGSPVVFSNSQKKMLKPSAACAVRGAPAGSWKCLSPWAEPTWK